MPTIGSLTRVLRGTPTRARLSAAAVLAASLAFIAMRFESRLPQASAEPAPPLFQAIEAELASGNVANAERILQGAPRADPAYAPLRRQTQALRASLERILQQQSDYADAAVDTLVQQSALLHAATLQSQLGRHRESNRTLERALAADAGCAACEDARGLNLRALGEFEAAVAAHARAVELAPRAGVFRDHLDDARRAEVAVREARRRLAARG